LHPFPTDQGGGRERWVVEFFGLGAKCLKLGECRRGRLPIGALEFHLRERIDERQLAGMVSRHDVPGAPARLHCGVDRGPPLDFDLVALRIFFLDDQKLLEERIDHDGRNCCEAHRAESAAIIHDVAADEAKIAFPIAL